jgi:hypothetical protein
MEGTDILETKIKVSKIQKETGRDYIFVKTHQTTNVKFYEYYPVENTKTLLVEVPMEKIAGNSYSLNYAEYMENENKAKEEYEEGIVAKTLGDVCVFLPKSKRQASYGKKEGAHPFYTSSQTCSKYCDEYDYVDECLIIGTGGTANIKYNSKFSCSTDNFVIKIKGEHSVKYVYYYLLNNIELLKKGFVGVGLQHISKEYVSNIKIPFPSLERQTEIVEYCENNDKLIEKLEKEIENNKKQTQQFMANIVKTHLQVEEQNDTILAKDESADESADEPADEPVENEIVCIDEKTNVEPNPVAIKIVKKVKKLIRIVKEETKA